MRVINLNGKTEDIPSDKFDPVRHTALFVDMLIKSGHNAVHESPLVLSVQDWLERDKPELWEFVSETGGVERWLDQLTGKTALYEGTSYSFSDGDKYCYLKEYLAPPLFMCDGFTIYEGVS